MYVHVSVQYNAALFSTVQCMQCQRVQASVCVLVVASEP